MRLYCKVLPTAFAFVLAWVCNAGATGILMPKTPGLPALGIKSHRVQVTITDQVAQTQVEQVFINNTDQVLEAVFIFPLPAGASVSEFAMMMNGKRVAGEVLEKNRAREIYTDIVRRMRDPGLLEYMGSNLFKASVFPIPARGEQKIDLSYSEVIKNDGGLAEYVFPLKTGEQASVTLSDFSVGVDIHSKVAIKSVYSPTHTVDVVKKGDNEVRVSFEEPKGALDHDFRLFYTLSEKDFGLSLVTHRPKGQDGYFIVLLAPKTEVKEEEILPKDVCFVIDTSGSMSGPKMDQARKALQYCVNSLGKRDRFNIVRFSTDVNTFKEGLADVNAEAQAQAAEFISKLEARGGTDINWALDKALGMKTGENRPYLMVFMTDGLPTLGTTDPKLILDNVLKKSQANIRIFTFGVGNDVNTQLLDQVAGQTRATSQYVAPEEDIEVKVSNFYDKVSAPVLSSLKIDLGKAEAYDLYPRETPDLFKGSQLLVLGRYKGEGHLAIKLTGTLNGKEQTFVYEDNFAKEESKNEFIPKLWGNRKVGYLLDEIRLKGEMPELVQEVIALSKEHGIMTPYTSYLVVEDAVARTPQASAPRRDGWNVPLGGGGGAVERERGESKSAAVNGAWNAADAAGVAPGAPAAESAASGAAGGGGRGKHIDDRLARRKAEEQRQMGFGLEKESGKDAVMASKTLRYMKEQEVAESDETERVATGTASAAGRTFQWREGVWTDESWKPENKPVEVKYMSDAYFRLIERDTQLKKVFALGERVLVVLKSGKAILVGETGKEDLTDGELDELFAVR
ncbi:MAG: VWA domain-containing protein [Planctomycetes bacterium]|nr:VWA domain-containing protein [Planctomycetota bacterium]